MPLPNIRLVAVVAHSPLDLAADEFSERFQRLSYLLPGRPRVHQLNFHRNNWLGVDART
jgi:hypothetical protein